MAKIILTSGLGFALGDHFRLIGLEITRPADGKRYTTLFHIDTPNVVFDRCWIHGDPVAETTHGIQIASGADKVAIIDSYLNDFHCTAVTGSCTDAQAISAADGGSTLKIVNNFLEAAGENIAFGGGAASELTSDIEIRLNHLFKPMIWNPLDPTFFGTKFVVKNNFELKEAQRVFFEGNILENNWGGFSQRGANILLTPKNQAGANGTNLCPICEVTDVTIRYNYIRHGAQGLQIANVLSDNKGWARAGHNYSIHDLIFDGMQYAGCYSCSATTAELASGYSGANPPPNVLNNVSVDHITLVTANAPKLAWLNMDGPPPGNVSSTPQMYNIQVTNWIVETGSSGVYPTGGGAENCSVAPLTYADKIAACWLGTSSLAGNLIVTKALVESKADTWSSGNQFADDWISVGFVNFNGGDGGDYHLTTAFKGTATDGTDPGANVDAVMGVVPLVE